MKAAMASIWVVIAATLLGALLFQNLSSWRANGWSRW
jgi:hypothetical protein